MNEIEQTQICRLDPESPGSNEPPRRVTRLLLLWPLAGIVLLVYAVITYRPLDDPLIYWVGAAPSLTVFVFINYAWRKARDATDVSFFPSTIWLVVGCLFLPIVFLANGVLDRSPVEQHRQIITRTILEHGRHGSVYYKVEVSSWRQNRSHEKLGVSYDQYLDARPGDSIIVETHRGAFGIPWLVSVHWP